MKYSFHFDLLVTVSYYDERPFSSVMEMTKKAELVKHEKVF
jgi:hypothetical protein